jgi:hypothetical protein
MNNIKYSPCERNYRSSQDVRLSNKRYNQMCQSNAKITQHKKGIKK